ncbi:MAG: carboxypeptidase regulatory-like domain-containing protein [Planctomycetes bacterium]|nr:carboxypeptidase regulatory-like domain-containing protein [Planctomycetota bacterium]
MRLLLLVLTLAGLILGAALWFSSSGRASRAQIELEGGASATDEAVGTELTDPHAPDASLSAGSRPSSAPRVALEERVEKPTVVDKVDRTKPSTPLECKVIDERSGLSLPRYLLRFEDSAGRRFEALTGDDGALTTTEPLAIGIVRVTPLDHKRRRQAGRVMEIDHIANAARAKIISVESGPTYTLTFGPETGPDLDQIDLRLTVSNDEARESTAFEPLRVMPPYRLDGESAWVRFPSFDADFTRANTIEARTRDGLWLGEAPATTVVGVAGANVHIQLGARAVVTGTVTSAGAPAAGVVVTVRARPKEGEKRPFERSARTDGKGRYRIEFVRPCEARVWTNSILHESADAEVSVESGAVLTQDFVLTPLPTVGRIAGSVVTETGAIEPRCSIALMRADERSGDPPRLRVRVNWESTRTGMVGRFDFGALPKGKYRLDVEENDWFEWSPRRITVEAPNEEVVFKVKDRVLVSDFAFEVRDADNGLVLRRFHLILETFEGERSIWSDSGTVVLTDYPEDKRLQWRLDKSGYPAQIGDMQSFAAQSFVDGRRRRTCELSVQPGWGDTVRITRRRDNKPVEGAVVSIAEREVGKTNADGIAKITARAKPTAITVALDGWRVAGNIDLRPPSQRNYRRFIGIQLVPAPKKK